MNYKDKYFPSKYLVCSDLQKKQHTLTINKLEEEKLQDGIKPMLTFVGAQKGLILNKTKWNMLEQLYGDNPELWPGKQIILAPGMTSYMGKPTTCINILPPAGAIFNEEQPPEPEEPPMDADDIPMSPDGIPF